MASPSRKPTRNPELDNVLLIVWRQALIDQVKAVSLGAETFSVRRTAKNKLAQVDFEWQGSAFRGLEQNPNTKSRWAQMARKGAKVMQFLSGGRYISVVAGGKITHYSSSV